MALHYDDDTDVNGDDLSGFGLWLAALHDDHDDDDDNDDLYKMVKTTSVLMMLNPENTLLNQCHALKALFKVPKICNLDFWIEITPPPPWNVSKNLSDLVVPSFPNVRILSLDRFPPL